VDDGLRDAMACLDGKLAKIDTCRAWFCIAIETRSTMRPFTIAMMETILVRSRWVTPLSENDG